MGRVSRRAFMGAAAAATSALWMGSRSAGANAAVGVGVIGAGRRGTALLAALAARPDARVVAVSDVCEAARARAAGMAPAAVHDHWQDLLDRSDVDAVLVATPDRWHGAMTLAAFDAGKDVYCETPMALSPDEADAVCRRAAATGRIAQVGAVEASHPAWHAARRQLQSPGALGALRWSQPILSPLHGAGCAVPWQRQWETSGGTAAARFHGPLAGLLTALGPQLPLQVSAVGGTETPGGLGTPDHLVMTLEYPGGHTVVLSTAPTAVGDGLGLIRGEGGVLHVEAYALRAVSEIGDSVPVLPLEPRPDHLTDWIGAVRDRHRPACDLELGRAVSVAIALGLQAYKERRTVTGRA